MPFFCCISFYICRCCYFLNISAFIVVFSLRYVSFLSISFFYYPVLLDSFCDSVLFFVVCMFYNPTFVVLFVFSFFHRIFSVNYFFVGFFFLGHFSFLSSFLKFSLLSLFML